MSPIDRLLDGLDVEVAPMVGGEAKTPTVQYTRDGAGIFALAGGAIVQLSRQSVMVLPAAPPRTGFALTGGAMRAAGTTASDTETVTVCVKIRVTYRAAVNLFDHLEEPLVEPLEGDDPIARSFEDVLDELVTARPGYHAMAEALLRRSFILLLRRSCQNADTRLSWLAAVEDTRLGRAMEAMRERPEHAFTLPELAELAGMSRTVFAARFTDALAQPPIDFLKTVRLTRAAQLLTRTDLPIKTVAAQVGYSSRSSFTRAFVASHGAAPAAFREAAGPPALHVPSPNRGRRGTRRSRISDGGNVIRLVRDASDRSPDADGAAERRRAG